MSYSPQPQPGTDAKELAEWTRKEFEKIEQGFALSDFVRLKSLSAEPKRLLEGLVVLADGVAWNPGSGQGVYAYYNSSWHKLG